MLEQNRMSDRELLEGAVVATAELSAAETSLTVVGLLSDVAAAVPGVSGAVVYRFEGTTPDPREPSPAVASGDVSTVPGASAPIAWDAYRDGEPVVRDALAGDGRAAVAYPLGGYGALVAASTAPTDDRTRSLLSILSTVARQRIEQIRCAETLRTRSRERDRCTERLTRVDEVTDLVFDLERAVTAAECRVDVERAVTEHLAALDPVAFAWVSQPEPEQGRVVPAAVAGRERGYLDAVDRTLTSSNAEPAVAAARDREQTVVDAVSSGFGAASWQREALARDVVSVRAVPLVGHGRFDGVLAVYLTDESAGSALWRRTLDHVASVISRTTSAFDRKRALLSDGAVEVEFRLTGGDDVFGRIAGAVGSTVRLDGVTACERQLTLFLSIPGASGDAVESTIARDPAVVSVTTVRRDDETRFEVVVRDEWLLSHVVDVGATPQSVEGTADCTTVILALPTDADVEGLVDSLERRYDRVTLRSRRERTRPVAREQYVWAKLDESLTDRQFETLRTAYFDGYFEWPRESTGEEVAAVLGISQPTFSRHLRTAERKLLSLLFATD